MKKNLLCLILPFISLILSGQEFNPYVSNARVIPAPLETGGTGTITFDFGNDGTSDLNSPGEAGMTITITLLGGIPDTADPLNSLGGTADNHFTWQFSGNTFTGTQSDIIQAGYDGNITIDYLVTTSSTEIDPGNGAQISIDPGPYSASDVPADNMTEAVTWTTCAEPPAPGIGSIIQPTCTINTGSVELTDLPSQWIITIYPGGGTRTGDTPTTIISGLAPETYNFTVTVETCVSPLSNDAVINDVPDIPGAPVIMEINQPGCGGTTGSVVLSGLPATGEWTVTTYPGGTTKTGSTTQTTIQELAPDTYYFTVSQGDCTSANSNDAVINPAGEIPAAPHISSVTQPTCSNATGSVTFNNLPSGSWTLTIYPGGSTVTGSGSNYTLSELSPDTYSFTVTSSADCTSDRSATVGIIATTSTDPPNVDNITQPTCSEPTGAVSLNRLPSGVTWTITIYPGSINRTGSGATYVWTGLAPGTYNFAVTPSGGCTSELSHDATVEPAPVVPSVPVPGDITQPGCTSSTGSVELTGLPPSGTWTVTVYPGGREIRGSGTTTVISGLLPGTYKFDVSSAEGCTSGQSSEVVIDQGSVVPDAPVPGTITQPTCTEPTGSIAVTGLPAGTWILTRSPGTIIIEGTGPAYTDQGLSQGTYTYTVTNSAGCISESSRRVTINEPLLVPASPDQRIDCAFGTGFAIVTVTSPTGFLYSYRIDNGDFTDNRTFFGVPNGQHTITVRSDDGCTTTGQPFNVSCGCVNPPLVMSGSHTGTVCGLTPVTVERNTFGGSATMVTITSDGAGTITPATVTNSPFNFTYTPGAADLGKTITITLTTNNPLGEPCSAATSTFALDVNQIPAAPVTGAITQPSCNVSTGSVILTGLPSGEWILTRNPGNVSMTASGPSVTVTGLESGTYTFTVTANGCTSTRGEEVVISPQPATPAAPSATRVVQPTCTVATGSIALGGLPAGAWSLTRYPGSVITTGSGSTANISAIAPGTYNFTVTSRDGCVSPSSANIVIDAQPVTPAAPQPGNITAPTCPDPHGRVALSGLPQDGAWTLVINPGGAHVSGSGGTATVTALNPGNYNFSVINNEGCTSPVSANVVIPDIPDPPVLVITDPRPVCAPGTVNINSPDVIQASSGDLTYTFWLNREATIPFATPERAVEGVYYVKVTNSAECSDTEPVRVDIRERPVAEAGPDQELDYEFTAFMDASEPGRQEKGLWSLYSGAGLPANPGDPGTRITDLGIGENIFLWTVTNDICPPATDSVKIVVKDLTIPTLITPNEDGRNDYFYLRGIEAFGPNELIIFDRRGVRVFNDPDYHNDWNGVDYNNRPLPDDTYYYILKAGKGKPRSGFILIRR